MTTATAANDAMRYARMLVEAESKGHGDTEGALHRLETRYGIGKWQIAHLRSGKAKSCEMSLFLRLRAAYVDLCERQMNRLNHSLAIEQAIGGNDDADLENLLAKAADLDAEIQAKRAAIKSRNQGE